MYLSLSYLILFCFSFSQELWDCTATDCQTIPGRLKQRMPLTTGLFLSVTDLMERVLLLTANKSDWGRSQAEVTQWSQVRRLIIAKSLMGGWDNGQKLQEKDFRYMFRSRVVMICCYVLPNKLTVLNKSRLNNQ